MSGIGAGIQNYRDVKTLTIDGSINPAHVPATATITITDSTALANGHTLKLRDGYNIINTFTINTSSSSSSSNVIGTSSVSNNSEAATQFAASINNSTAAKFSAVANDSVVTVSHNITWGRNFGNATLSGEASGTGLNDNTTTDGSSGTATGFTVSNFSGGKEGIASLKINQTQLVGRGSFSYITATRKSILESRTGMGSSSTPLKFRTPTDWDLSWHHRLGPIWTPESCTGSLKTWLTSHNIEVNTTTFQQVVQVNDLSSESNDYIQSTSAQQPLVDDPSSQNNNFRPLEFDGGTYNLYRNGYGTDYDVGTSDDFGIFFVIKTSNDSNDTQFILQMGSSTANGSVGISLDTTSSNKTLNIVTRLGSDTTVSYPTAFDHRVNHILFIGRIGGVQTVRVDGAAVSASTGTSWQAINPGGTDSVIGCSYAGLSQTNAFAGKFYEFIFLGEASANQVKADYKLVEGYLAYKYNLVSSLPNDHPYKNEAPRATLSL
jgi:hypothetical protein